MSLELAEDHLGKDPSAQTGLDGGSLEPSTPESVGLRKHWRSLQDASRRSAQALSDGLVRLSRRMAKAGRSSLERRHITLIVDNDAIRIVVFRGRRVTAWGTANHHSGVNEEWPEAEQDDQSLPLLMRRMGIQRGKTISGLSLHLSLVRNLELPKIGRRYLPQVIASEIEEQIPFMLGEVNLVWRAHKKTSHTSQVVAIATPRQGMNQHVQWLKTAGVKVRGIYAKSTALASTSGLEDGILAYLQEGSAELVAVRRGVPVAVHGVKVSIDGQQAEETAHEIFRAVEQVAGYQASLDIEEERDLLPVVLMGQMANPIEFSERLGQLSGRTVSSMPLTVAYPPHFPASEYAANIGLAAAHAASAPTWWKVGAKRPRTLNLLPERDAPRPFPLKFLATSAALLALGFLAFNSLAPAHRAVSSEVSLLSAHLSTLQNQERQERLLLASAQARAEDLQAGNLAAQSLGITLETLNVDRQLLLERLVAATSEAVPSGITLTGISLQGTSLGMSGSGSSLDSLITFSTALRESGLFKEVRVVQVSGTETTAASNLGLAGPSAGGIVFQMKATMALDTPAGTP